MVHRFGEFWGMHWIWWVLWIIFIVWVFATPSDIPGRRSKKNNPADILKKRLANGEITKEEFEEMNQILKR